MKEVTVKNFIRDFIFLMAAQTLSPGRHGLVFKYFFSFPQTFVISSRTRAKGMSHLT